jgi:sulfite exporter TauE/SafE
MFEGEKTYVFWAGLIILGLASVGLFTVIWYNVVSLYPYWWKYSVPFIVAAIVFMLIGLYMMESGTRREKERKIQPLKEQLFTHIRNIGRITMATRKKLLTSLLVAFLIGLGGGYLISKSQSQIENLLGIRHGTL